MSVRERINPRGCARAIDLEGGQRDIETIGFLYGETSYKRRTATVKAFAD